MSLIKVQNIDGVIWNFEEKVIDIIKAYHDYGEINISLCNEGPDAELLGLYNVLDLVSEKFNFDKKKITIQTGNLLEKHTEYNIKIDRPRRSTEYFHGQNYLKDHHDLVCKDIKKHFGIFIGRSNWKRLYLSAIIYLHYKDISIQTFHYESKSDFHKTHLGLEKLLHIKGNQVIQLVEPLINAAPLILDKVQNYPIISPSNYEIITHYNDFFVDVVCETFSKGKTFFPTEKIWRPIITKTPFMVQGPVGFLAGLKKLGFKTFDAWWDESYDEDDEQVALETIIRNLNKISKYSVEDLKKIYSSMEEVLDHNYNTFVSLKDEKFKLLYD